MMNLWRGSLHRLESLALWHSYFPLIPFPITGIQRQWALPTVKRLLDKEAKRLRKCEVSMEFVRLAYDLKFRGAGNFLAMRLAAENRLWEKAHSRQNEVRERYQELESLWMFLREIRMLSPEWGEDLEEFLQSISKEPFRRKLRDDLACFYSGQNSSALSR